MRVVVVGAGFAGLSAGVRIAKVRHHDVTLLESSERVGGRLRRIEGRWAHAPETFTLPGVVRDLFRKSGRPLERHLDLIHPEPRSHVFVHDQQTERLDLPCGRRGDQHDAISALTGADEWSPWLDSLDPLWDPLRRDVIEKVLVGPPSHILPRKLRRTLRLSTSLHQLTRAGLTDERLRAMVFDPHLLAGQDPRYVPGVAALSHLLERRFARWTCGEDGIEVGLEPLADVLEQRLVERRIDLRTSTPVDDVTRDGQRVTGVVLSDGSTIEADHVLWCAPELPSSLIAPAVERITPPTHTLVQLADPEALPHDLWVHGQVPLHAWAGAPGHWTLAHTSGADPLKLLAAAGFDVADRIEESRILTPAHLMATGHSGWRLAPRWRSRWKSLLDRPGVNPPPGITFAGAGAQWGPSLELIGMTTAIQVDYLS
jgi:phytoene dehydrogenase-like protein